MAYTVTKLAKISGISVRTLHWYDEIGLLKPAYSGSNGYRYYEEDQLLTLQHILFYKELGFELKQIQQIINQGNFNKIKALKSHRETLQKNLQKIKKLIVTIDKTLEHLTGVKKMKEKDFFSGFSKEQQEEYERQIIKRFGEQGKSHIEESKQNAKKMSPHDHEILKNEFHSICTELAILINRNCKPNSKEVQILIQRHFKLLSKFWTPTKETYAQHIDFIIESDLRKAYEIYHPLLPTFLKDSLLGGAAP